MNWKNRSNSAGLGPLPRSLARRRLARRAYHRLGQQRATYVLGAVSDRRGEHSAVEGHGEVEGVICVAPTGRLINASRDLAIR